MKLSGKLAFCSPPSPRLQPVRSIRCHRQKRSNCRSCRMPAMRLGESLWRGQHLCDAQSKIHVDVNYIGSSIKRKIPHVFNDHGSRYPPAGIQREIFRSPNSFDVNSIRLPARSTRRSTRSIFRSATESTAAAGKWLLRNSARIRAESSANEKGLPM